VFRANETIGIITKQEQQQKQQKGMKTHVEQ
jgi:hypothetical protein